VPDTCAWVAGYVDGIDDPGMGWARYAQTIRIFVLNSGLFYIQPSERTVSGERTHAKRAAARVDACTDAFARPGS
jgi:hypothetical protein